MSPIPKPPKAKSPVQKAIEQLIAETQRKGSAMIDGVIVHPEDLPALKSLLDEPSVSRPEVRSTLFAQPLPSGGPLTEAWRKEVERMRNNPPPIMPLGKSATVISWDEQHTMDRTELQQQLEDSLWARATYHTPAFTQEDLYKHVGPGHMEDDWYVKRVYPDEVHLLCKCEMILVMARCAYDWEDESGQMVRCEELAFPAEATLRRDTRCGQHHGQ